MTRNDGLRRLLMLERKRALERWPPSRPDDRLAALGAGEPLLGSAAEMLRVLMHAGLPYRQYAYGGADWGTVFMFDEHDRSIEFVNPPSVSAVL